MAVILFKPAAGTAAAATGQVNVYYMRACVCARAAAAAAARSLARSLVNAVTTDAFGIAGYKQGG